MQALHDVLKKSYERHSRLYDDLGEFGRVLRSYRHLPNLKPVMYRNGTLTVSVPLTVYSPDVRFSLEELKAFLIANTAQKNLRSVRIVPR